MISIEQVEKLLEYADVTFEEARDALEHCEGNLLDAIVHLERKGKVVSRGGTRSGPVTVLPGNAQEEKDYKQPKGSDFSESIRKFFKWIGEEFDRATQSIFIASHKEDDIISMPAVIFWVVAICGFYFVIPALLISTLFGMRYRFEPKDDTKEDTDESEKL